MDKLNKDSVIGISALLVHAANIDEIYSDHEKDLVKDFIKSYLKDDDVNEILKKAEEIENNSNQLLNYTNIIKENSIEILGQRPVLESRRAAATTPTAPACGDKKKHSAPSPQESRHDLRVRRCVNPSTTRCPFVGCLRASLVTSFSWPAFS